MSPNMLPARASAPGKIILFGEHAVVHGQPAIAVPLSAVQATAEAAPGPPGSGLVVAAPDVNLTLPVTPEPEPASAPIAAALAYPLQLALRALAIPPPDLRVTLRSTIPIASGLGSGAAIATALVRALYRACAHPLTNETLNALIYEVEKYHHGTPSGIDNTVIVYEQPVYFVRGEPIETFAIAQPFTLLVGDTGRASPTHLAVSDVRALYEAEPARIGAIFARIGAISHAARRIITGEDTAHSEPSTQTNTSSTIAIEALTIETLGALMDENHALLRALTVSSPELDRLCDAARRAGAAGAKLSGGGRGGNMIALAAPDPARSHAPAIAAALRAAGAVNIITTTVELTR